MSRHTNHISATDDPESDGSYDLNRPTGLARRSQSSRDKIADEAFSFLYTESSKRRGYGDQPLMHYIDTIYIPLGKAISQHGRKPKRTLIKRVCQIIDINDANNIDKLTERLNKAHLEESSEMEQRHLKLIEEFGHVSTQYVELSTIQEDLIKDLRDLRLENDVLTEKSQEIGNKFVSQQKDLDKQIAIVEEMQKETEREKEKETKKGEEKENMPRYLTTGIEEKFEPTNMVGIPQDMEMAIHGRDGNNEFQIWHEDIKIWAQEERMEANEYIVQTLKDKTRLYISALASLNLKEIPIKTMSRNLRATVGENHYLYGAFNVLCRSNDNFGENARKHIRVLSDSIFNEQRLKIFKYIIQQAGEYSKSIEIALKGGSSWEPMFNSSKVKQTCNTVGTNPQRTRRAKKAKQKRIRSDDEEMIAEDLYRKERAEKEAQKGAKKDNRRLSILPNEYHDEYFQCLDPETGKTQRKLARVDALGNKEFYDDYPEKMPNTDDEEDEVERTYPQTDSDSSTNSMESSMSSMNITRPESPRQTRSLRKTKSRSASSEDSENENVNPKQGRMQIEPKKSL